MSGQTDKKDTGRKVKVDLSDVPDEDPIDKLERWFRDANIHDYGGQDSPGGGALRELNQNQGVGVTKGNPSGPRKRRLSGTDENEGVKRNKSITTPRT